MAVTRQNPNVVYLGGPGYDLPGANLSSQGADAASAFTASAAITPGDLVELHSDSGVLKFRPHASATETHAVFVAVDNPLMNDGINDDYAVGDVVHAKALMRGDKFYGFIESGQNIALGALLQSAGDGSLKAASATTADANLADFISLDAPGAVTARTRLRVMVIR